MTEVPVIIRHLTQQQALRVALVENLQREDLNPVEETEGILQLLSHHLEYDLEEVVRLLYRMQNDVQRMNNNIIIHHEMQIVVKVFSELGRMSWESFVSNRLGLLKLPTDIQEALRRGQIEYTKARAIAKVKNESARKSLLFEAIAECLSLTQIKERGVADLRYEKLNMQVIGTIIHKASGASTDLFHTLIKQHQERIADLKAGTSEEEPEENLKTKIKGALTKANKSKAWSDPKKQKRLQKILRELESLLVD